MSEWISYLNGSLSVYDGRGHRIDRVRAVRDVEGGVQVRILATVSGDQLCVCGRDGSGMAAIEFEAFVPGGMIASHR